MAENNFVPGARWNPVVGGEARRVVEKLPTDDAKAAVLDSARSILARGANPEEKNAQRTGLVVGYVQSGKTLSFTTVMALARDNGYRVVIVVTGISKPLLGQSIKRLKKDLSIDDDDSLLRWMHFENPTFENYEAVKRVLEEWGDSEVPDSECPTVLITVMKNHSHLKNLAYLISQLNMHGAPALMIDDEADQASLNTQIAKGRESTTYRRLLELRAAVPCHTFLQYTATPQAPLLINIIDLLSPEFAEVLEPGGGYVGGTAFFGGEQPHVRRIPDQEVPVNNETDAAPDSLIHAIRIFLVGVAAGLEQGRGLGNMNRSMLVHPSRTTPEHQQYFNWIKIILGDWNNLVRQPENDPDRISFTEDLQIAYADLARTAVDIPSFDAIVGKLQRALRHINVVIMNAANTPTPEINWRESYGWILVGGQAMDRGFTVEGLTVTYMPRGTGIGNADTIQQRARFLGYKASYLGYCRVYLEQDLLTAFEDYVEHEEDVRSQLQAVCEQNLPLSEWTRRFVLSPNLRPCRDNVIQHCYVRGAYSDDLIDQKFAGDSNIVINANREVAQRFFNPLAFTEDKEHEEWPSAQRHSVCSSARLDNAVRQFLIPYQFSSGFDSDRRNIFLLQFSHALDENPDETCAVYLMSRGERRKRAISKNGKIRELFQGTNPGTDYPGDRAMVDPENATIQVHFLDLTDGRNGPTVAENVPVIAVWIPRRMGLPLLIQNQPQA